MQIEKRILERPEQTVWVMNDFSDIASNKTASKTLSRMEECGFLRKVMQGVFCSLSGTAMPQPHEIASALARSNSHVIVPCGDTVLHLLGVRDEKPRMWTYLTDGVYRTYEYGNILIEFRHASERAYASLSQKTAWIIQAVKAIGKGDNRELLYRHLAAVITPAEKRKMKTEIGRTAAWIRTTLQQILNL
ncbi:MAG: hypothetical protein CW338_07125 [Clostridiales bacterium]|nr:hypothetical protein [Clostridiales bacterium]